MTIFRNIILEIIPCTPISLICKHSQVFKNYKIPLVDNINFVKFNHIYFDLYRIKKLPLFDFSAFPLIPPHSSSPLFISSFPLPSFLLIRLHITRATNNHITVSLSLAPKPVVYSPLITPLSITFWKLTKYSLGYGCKWILALSCENRFRFLIKLERCGVMNFDLRIWVFDVQKTKLPK